MGGFNVEDFLAVASLEVKVLILSVPLLLLVLVLGFSFKSHLSPDKLGFWLCFGLTIISPFNNCH